MTAPPVPFATFSAMLMGPKLLVTNGDDGRDDATGFRDDHGIDQPVVEPLERYRSKDLRKEVYRLKLKLKRRGPDMNDHKNGYIALLRAYWREHPPNVNKVAHATETTTEPPLLWEEESAAQFKSEEMQFPPLPQLHERASTLSVFPTPLPSSPHAAYQSQVVLPSTPAPIVAREHGPVNSNTVVLQDLTSQDSSVNEVSETSGYSSEVSDEECADNGDDEFSQIPCTSSEQPQTTNYVNATTAHLRPSPDAAGAFGDDPTNSPLLMPSTDIPSHRPEDDLDARIKRTNYWESRLTMSKRKIHELHGELRVAVEDEEIALLRDELTYYTRERKRAVRSLLVDSGAERKGDQIV